MIIKTVLNTDLNDIIKIKVNMHKANSHLNDLDGIYETFYDLVDAINRFCNKHRDYRGNDQWLEMDLTTDSLMVQDVYSGMDDWRPIYDVVGDLQYLTKSAVKERAYFIYLKTGNENSDVNYFQALSDMMKYIR